LNTGKLSTGVASGKFAVLVLGRIRGTGFCTDPQRWFGKN
jgi:hypothetical protein